MTFNRCSLSVFSSPCSEDIIDARLPRLIVESCFSDSIELVPSGVVSSQGVELELVMDEVLEDDEGEKAEGERESLLEGVIRMLLLVGALLPMSIVMQAVSEGDVLRAVHSGATSSFGSTIIVVIWALAGAPLGGAMSCSENKEVPR